MQRKIYTSQQVNHSSRGISDVEVSKAVTEAVIARRQCCRKVGRFWMEVQA